MGVTPALTARRLKHEFDILGYTRTDLRHTLRIASL